MRQWSPCVFYSLELSLSHLLVCWSGVRPTLNYLMTHCTVSGLQRYCSIWTVYYLQIQGVFQGCVLSPFWDESWRQSISLSSFLSSPPFSPSPTDVRRCLFRQLERVHRLVRSLVWVLKIRVWVAWSGELGDYCSCSLAVRVESVAELTSSEGRR